MFLRTIMRLLVALCVVSRIVKATDPCTAGLIGFNSDPNIANVPAGVENCEVIKPRNSTSYQIVVFTMTAGHDLSLPNLKVIELSDASPPLVISAFPGSAGSWKLSLPNLHSLKGTVTVSVPETEGPYGFEAPQLSCWNSSTSLPAMTVVGEDGGVTFEADIGSATADGVSIRGILEVTDTAAPNVDISKSKFKSVMELYVIQKETNDTITFNGLKQITDTFSVIQSDGDKDSGDSPTAPPIKLNLPDLVYANTISISQSNVEITAPGLVKFNDVSSIQSYGGITAAQGNLEMAPSSNGFSQSYECDCTLNFANIWTEGMCNPYCSNTMEPTPLTTCDYSGSGGGGGGGGSGGDSSSSSDSAQLSGGAIAGIVIAILVVVGIIIGGYVLSQMKKKKRLAAAQMPTTVAQGNVVTKNPVVQQSAGAMPPPPPP